MQDASELGKQKDMCLSFSEVSELTGTTPSNLRFFEEEGILDIPRNGAGCRVFHRKEMEELPGLACLKHSGLKLKEIKRFFHLVRQGNSTLRQRYRMLQEGHQAMKTRIRELKYSKIKMEYIGQCCEAYDKGEPLPQVNPAWMDSFLKQKFEEGADAWACCREGQMEATRFTQQHIPFFRQNAFRRKCFSDNP